MTQLEIANSRCHNQQLTETGIRTAGELVAWFGAVQGQEYAQTKWGLGLRLPHLRDKDIEAELDEGKMIRTHLLRPTWHFVRAKDVSWLLQLSAPRVHAVNGTMYRKLNLEPEELKRYGDWIGEALEGNRHLTRPEIADLLAEKKVHAEGMRLSYIMMHAELEGLVCSGKRKNNRFTYALLKERCPATQLLTREEALAEITVRYFQSRGPATMADFSTWSGLTMSDCKSGVELQKDKVERMTVDNVDYYRCDNLRTAVAKPHLLLLPEYDEMIMGYKNRQALFQAFDIMENEFNTIRTVHNCMILCNSQVTGTYKRTIRGKSAFFDFDFYRKLNKDERRMLEDQLAFFTWFSGLKVMA
ncbi:MAG: winged helix DNA-binding domain-containing protein [Tannerella sp.]|jgi:hypothetical protein|nr:winged helix DNA-binding domain-containing protein [Tannerella sp.]